jgi:GH25 family lysozyme M1 (1,4-beta-N-acetylmuramidase)
MKLIDVSSHNGVIDFQKVKDSGIVGVIIRAGFGRNDVDKRFETNIKGAIKAGLHIGIYWFAYAYTVERAKQEADFCLKTLKPYKDHIDLPVFYDYEDDSVRYAKEHGVTPNRELITSIYLTFCNAMKKAGYKGGYYTGKNFIKNYLTIDKLKGFYFWYAQYYKEPSYKSDIWQYSDKGKVPGLKGNVDMNELYNTDLINEPSKKPDKPKEEQKTEEKKEDPAKVTTYTVKKGDTLTAIARRFGTTVNKIMAANPAIKDRNLIYVGQKINIK